MRHFETTCPALQSRPWPCVAECDQLSVDFHEFLDQSQRDQTSWLIESRQNHEEHADLVNRYLATAYAYRLGYLDSPCHRGTNDDLEIRLERAKILLERELVELLGNPAMPRVASQERLVTHLQSLIASNPGLNHPLFRYLEDEASDKAIRTFLLNEVIRNEIVDDEVAWLVAGHQGMMKEAAAINLFDECGRGQQRHFHTYWLRMLLESFDGWEDLLRYRSGPRPWFAGITSNVFAMLLTRSPYKWAAYGHFIITESWVPLHFAPILKAMDRVGLRQGNNDLYFTAHITLDPTHTEELVLGLKSQTPRLNTSQCSGVLWGCHLAIAGAVQQYDKMLVYLKAI